MSMEMKRFHTVMHLAMVLRSFLFVLFTVDSLGAIYIWSHTDAMLTYTHAYMVGTGIFLGNIYLNPFIMKKS